MPVHDWTRVSAGTFHAFHTVWIGELMKALNGGLLPAGYYALAEQHAGAMIADVLTLEEPVAAPGTRADHDGGGVSVQAPPQVRRRRVASPEIAYRAARKTLAIRHSSGHRLVALIEIASPGNKDRPDSVAEFVGKVHHALDAGVHALVVDLFPPGPHDPRGLCAAVWERYGPPGGEGAPAPGLPLTFASYLAGEVAEAYEEDLAVGASLPAMPLFLTRRTYVHVPLEPTYEAAYRGLPAFWREVIEGRRDPGAR